MKRRLSIDELQRKHGVDAPHARHVGNLADKLFLAVRRRHRLRAADRRILAAAAALHEMERPAGRPGASRRSAAVACPGAYRVLQQGLAGFGTADTRLVALVIALQDSRVAVRRPPGFAELLSGVVERAWRLAAILRVADAMDGACIQDVTIASIRPSPEGFTAMLRIRSAFTSLERIRAACRPWERTFHDGLTLRALPAPRASLFTGVVGPGDSALEALRRILFTQFRVMETSLEGIRQRTDTVSLHDFRVALRRLRSALRMYKPLLKKTTAKRLASDLGALSGKLGPFRDGQAWLEFMDARRTREACAGEAGWPTYVRGRRRAVESERNALRGICRADALEPMDRVSRFLRSDPLWEDADRDPPFALFAASRLERVHARAVRLASADPRDLDDEHLHGMRKSFRQARYRAEFAAPALGARVADMARLFKELADHLGAVHDMDVHLARATAGREHCPAGLVKHMRRRRRREMAAYIEAKEALARNKFRKKLRVMLWNMAS